MTSPKTNTERQAIVVIHGMGEQKPMDTLRDFVEMIAPEIPNSTKRKFYNKPDVISETFELRRLTANEQKNTIKTDYFEYYWAHKMSGTKLSDIYWWIKTILFRPPRHIPARIRWVYYFFWFTIIITLITLVFFIYFQATDSINNPIKKVIDCYTPPVVRFVLGVVWLGLSYFLISYLGDAVRYMTPNSGNITSRQDIRKTGIDLLTNLHDAKITVVENGATIEKNRYDRIVVVGHSLGSVIAYDLIKFMWVKHNTQIKLTKKQLKEISTAANELNQKPTSAHREQYRKKQFELWASQNHMLDSWRISDFITLGSPLAHAELLLAANPNELNLKTIEREYPTCPPIPEDSGEFFYKNPDVKLEVLHHAAPFALTRWTNFTFSKDHLGGNINVFGHGIENHLQASESRIYNIVPFLAHVRYWGKNEQSMIKLIREKLQLRIKKL